MTPTDSSNNATAARFQGLEIESAAPAFQPAVGFGFATPGKDEKGVWRTALGHTATETHHHVAKVWQDKCIPMSAVMQSVAESAKGKSDVTVPQSDLRVYASGGTLNLGWGDSSAEMTTFAVKKLAAATGRYAQDGPGIPHGMVDYYMARPDRMHILADELTIALSDRVAHTDQKKDAVTRGRKVSEGLLLRLRDNGQVCRTVLTDKFVTSMDNELVLNLLQDVMGSKFGSALWSHAADDEDKLRGNILMPDSMKQLPDSDYGVGFRLSNSEVGDGSLDLAGFLFRCICVNGMIWGRKNAAVTLNKRHLNGMDVSALRADITKAVESAGIQAFKMLDLLQATAEIQLRNRLALITSLSQDNGLSKDMSKAWVKGYEDTLTEPNAREDTAFTLLNGLTAAARGFDGDERLKMEEAAGKILSPRDNLALATLWDSYQDRAETVEPKTIELYTMA